MARRRKAGRRSNGEGTIYQRPDGRWSGQCTLRVDPLTNKAERLTVYAESQAECVEKLRAAREKRAAQTGSVASSTVRDAYDLWMAQLKGTTKPQSVAKYVNDAGPVLRHLGPVRLRDLTPTGVLRFHAAMGALSAGKQHRAAKALRSIFKAAMKLGVCASDPTTTVAVPKIPRARPNPLSREQAAHLLACAGGDRLEALYWLAIDSGARQGELWALMPEDVDLERGEIRISKALTQFEGVFRIQEAKTDRSRRRVGLTPQTVAKLRQVPTTPGRPVFGMKGTQGGTWMRASTFTEDYWTPLRRRAGLKVRFHDLRHTCATLLLLAGVHPKVVSERLGHASIQITLDTYSHLLPGMQQTATEALGRLLPGHAEPEGPPRSLLRAHAKHALQGDGTPLQ